MMNIKICGLTTLEDAEYCHQQGAWALGFNFYPTSPRCVTKTAAKKIIQALPQSILKVGIYVNASYDTLLQDIDELGLDMVQVYAPLHNAPHSFKDRVILSLQAATTRDLPSASILSAYRYILLDAPGMAHQTMPGGTGRLANWVLAETMAREYPLILAGGLNPSNARAAIDTVNPFAIDIASGVEKAPGIKDQSQINLLFEECKYDN